MLSCQQHRHSRERGNPRSGSPLGNPGVEGCFAYRYLQNRYRLTRRRLVDSEINCQYLSPDHFQVQVNEISSIFDSLE